MLHKMAYPISRYLDLRVDGDALIDAIFCEFHIFNDRPKSCVRRDHMDRIQMPCDVDPRLGLTFEKGVLGDVPPLKDHKLPPPQFLTGCVLVLRQRFRQH